MKNDKGGLAAVALATVGLFMLFTQAKNEDKRETASEAPSKLTSELLSWKISVR